MNTQPERAIETSNSDIKTSDGTSMPFYAAVPKDRAKAPGIIVLQEAFGVNSRIRSVTERFARQGYLAIAPELFHRTAPRGIRRECDVAFESGRFLLRRRHPASALFYGGLSAAGPSLNVCAAVNRDTCPPTRV